jgi:hypothetical protein
MAAPDSLMWWECVLIDPLIRMAKTIPGLRDKRNGQSVLAVVAHVQEVSG